jgi:hypothetical protein
MVRDIHPAAGGLLSYFTRHRTAANLLLVLMVVAGLAAIPNMRAQFFPDVVIDDVTVSVVWDGAGADDIDSAVVQPLESALLAVDGVASASSAKGKTGISGPPNSTPATVNRDRLPSDLTAVRGNLDLRSSSLISLPGNLFSIIDPSPLFHTQLG